jgi:hypothetical protein
MQGSLNQQMLMKAAYSPLDDNPDISRMTRLVNIFRLLPATAVQYLKIWKWSSNLTPISTLK